MKIIKRCLAAVALAGAATSVMSGTAHADQRFEVTSNSYYTIDQSLNTMTASSGSQTALAG